VSSERERYADEMNCSEGEMTGQDFDMKGRTPHLLSNGSPLVEKYRRKELRDAVSLEQFIPSHFVKK
jgi:hypothetical protein